MRPPSQRNTKQIMLNLNILNKYSGRQRRARVNRDGGKPKKKIVNSAVHTEIGVISDLGPLIDEADIYIYIQFLETFLT